MAIPGKPSLFLKGWKWKRSGSEGEKLVDKLEEVEVGETVIRIQWMRKYKLKRRRMVLVLP